MARWIETFSKAYIGFMLEATVFTDLPTTDLDNPAGLQNYYLSDRTKQYLSISDAITVKTGTTVVGSATIADPSTYTLQRLGGIVRFAVAQPSSTKAWLSGKYLPMYRLLGSHNIGNTSARAEIDTTGGGDADMSGAPGRPKRGGSFTFIPGDTITNAAAKVVTMKNMLEASAKAGAEVVIAIQNDTRNALLPRDTMYSFIGNTDMQRNLNTAITMPVTYYQAICSDANAFEFIDYVS